MGAVIRVLLVDDDALVRSGLRMMLAGAPQIEVVGEADDGREVLAAVDRHRPDVVLMDIRMPQLDGIEATRLLRAQPSPPAVIVLTTFDADELVLRRAARRRRRLPAQGHAAGRDRARDRARPRRRGHALPHGHAAADRARRRRRRRGGRRERRAGRLERSARASARWRCAVGSGSSNAEIAAELHMSVATVKAHVSRLLVKLGVENRVQVALLVQDAS